MIGFIVAGGQSMRMNGKRKCLLDLSGKTILERITLRISGQVHSVVLNVNDAEPELRNFGLPIIPDALPGSLGPLAGLHACMKYAADKKPAETWIATVASDTPFIPTDLVAQLSMFAKDEFDVVVAKSADQTHRMSALWRVALLDQLETAILEHDLRAVRHWLARCRVRQVEFADTPYDPFFNINDAKDLTEGERIAREHNL